MDVNRKTTVNKRILIQWAKEALDGLMTINLCGIGRNPSIWLTESNGSGWDMNFTAKVGGK